jgi:hypothetical protein
MFGVLASFACHWSGKERSVVIIIIMKIQYLCTDVLLQQPHGPKQKECNIQTQITINNKQDTNGTNTNQISKMELKQVSRITFEVRLDVTSNLSATVGLLEIMKFATD